MSWNGRRGTEKDTDYTAAAAAAVTACRNVWSCCSRMAMVLFLLNGLCFSEKKCCCFPACLLYSPALLHHCAAVASSARCVPPAPVANFRCLLPLLLLLSTMLLLQEGMQASAGTYCARYHGAPDVCCKACSSLLQGRQAATAAGNAVLIPLPISAAALHCCCKGGVESGLNPGQLHPKFGRAVV